MGPNKQKRPNKQRDTRFSQRRANFFRKKQDGDESGKNAHSFLSEANRAMMIDVLQHVATAGSAPISDKHFDPNSSGGGPNTIMFKKNTALSPTEIIGLTLERYGFPPDVVSAYMAEIALKPDVPCNFRTIGELLASEDNCKFLAQASWDLFAMMLWNTETEENDGADENDDDDEENLAMQREMADSEIESLEMVFGLDSFVQYTAGNIVRYATSSSSASGGGGGMNDRELCVRVESKDGLPISIFIRLSEFYPMEPPLVAIDLTPSSSNPPVTTTGASAAAASKVTKKGSKGKKEEGVTTHLVPGHHGQQGADFIVSPSSTKLSAVFRRKVLDAAVEAAESLRGMPALISLIGSVKELVESSRAALVENMDAAAPPSSNNAVSKKKESEAEQKKQRDVFLQRLKEVKPEETHTTPLLVKECDEKLAKKHSTNNKINNNNGKKSTTAGDQKQKANVQQMAGHDEDGEEISALVMPQAVKLDVIDSKGGESGADGAAAATSSSASTGLISGKSAPRPLKRNPDEDARHAAKWKNLKEKGELMSVRNNLPAVKVKEDLRAALRESNVVVVGGETGSGKTTQVPQFVYEFACEDGNASLCNILVTQPRRLAATAVAIRVAEERGEDIGGTVGYSIRLENRMSAETKLLYCTTGIVLRRLQVDGVLAKVSHVIVDEIHERGVDTDFLLILLKDLLTRRKDLKLILMSATMNSDLFARYFGNAPVISISGRTHPVEVQFLESIVPAVKYVLEEFSPYAKSDTEGRKQQKQQQRNKSKHMLEIDFSKKDYEDEVQVVKGVQQFAKITNGDMKTAETLSMMNLDVINYELIEQLVAHIDTTFRYEGAILIFLPGLAEIQRCCDELRSNPDLQRKCIIYNLHSSLGSTEQRAVFKKAPRGKRKVVVGTNIMETSITIDDAVFVIDAGKVKENRYDARRSMSQLVSVWVSQANAKQRMGRAGRVRPGHCFRLYTSDQFSKFEEHQLCEMHRVPLEGLVLQIYTLNLGDEMEYLSKALSPPEEKAVMSSVKVLTNLGALTREKRLTSLGLHLANLPLDVRIGKIIIHGALLKCLDAVLTIAACVSVRSPFLASIEDQDQINAIRKAFAGTHKSDHVCSWLAYLKWISTLKKPREAGGGDLAARNFCRDAFLSVNTLLQIQSTKRQYERYLAEAGFLECTAQQKKAAGANNFLFDSYVTIDENIHESGGPAYNENTANIRCVLACLVAGLYPNVARVLPIKNPSFKGPRKIVTLDGSDVIIHPSSVLGYEKELPTQLVCYVDKVKTSQVFLRDVSMISPFHVIIFGSGSRYLQNYNEIVIDEAVAFRCNEEEALLLMHLKQQFETALRMKINDPQLTWETVSDTVVKAIVRLLRDEGTKGSKPLVVLERAERQYLTAPLNKGLSTSGGGNAASGGPPPPPEDQPFQTYKTCFNCGEAGHVSKFCPKPGRPKDKGAPTVRCFVCGDWHHPTECSLTKSTSGA